MSNRPHWLAERVLDWIDDGCVLFDKRLDCVYANRSGGALFGLLPDDLIGRSLHSDFSTSLAPEFQREALTAFSNQKPARVTLHDEPAGKWHEVSLHPSADGLLAIVADVTSNMRTELERAAQAEYLQQLVDQLPAFLWVIDRDLIVRRIEGGRPMLKALDRDRLIGMSQLEVTQMGCNAEDTELSMEMHRRVLRGFPGQYRATWKGITLESRVRPLRDRDDNIVGIVGVGIDVTKEAALESQLRQSQKLEALGQLAGGVAHDFNNVLAAIDGFAQLLHEDLAADDPRRKDVEEILKAAERATRITRQLLAFSRHQVPSAKRVNIIDVVHELSRMLRALLPASITLRVSPDVESAPIEVFADRSQLEQVIMNLTLNARDAMPTRGTLFIDVRTGSTPDAAHTAILEVRDTGIGMAPEIQSRVFEPFFTTKEHGRGTGLGLATVYGIVRQHSGAIEIASAPGQGTSVTVRLPMAPAGEETVVEAMPSVERTQGGRVLVVEDEAHVREVTARLLQRAGYDASTASDAESALGMLTSCGPFDLVLTDSAMPGMRGEDLAAEITRVQPGLPVLLMSGYTDLERSPSSSAVAGYLQKPFAMSVLLAEVRRALTRERPLSE